MLSRREFLKRGAAAGAGTLLLNFAKYAKSWEKGENMPLKDRLFQALRQSKADYAEIRFENDDSNAIAYRGKEIETVNSGRFLGGIVRACVKGGWGIATFDSLDDLEKSVAEAGEAAVFVGKEKTSLAETEKIDAVVHAKLERDFRGISLDDKLSLISKYNDIILKSSPRIITSNVRYTDAFRAVHFASSNGSYFMEERPRIELVFAAVAQDGSLVQRAWDAASSVRTYDAVVGLEERVAETAERAAALLKAPPCEGGVHTVVLDPLLAGVFAHEAFGHLSEADFLYENPKMRDLMCLGRKMGVQELNIVDDGRMPGFMGSLAFDDEGTRASKTYLIKDGILVNHLHSRETAAKMGEKPTGNARAINRNHPPIVRMTNTYIEAGKADFQNLLSGVEKGIYACDAFGGQTQMEMFTFSAAYGYKIENGRKGELIRDVTLTGNVFETLHRIDGFGKDFQIPPSAGGCGKGGQSPLPVTCGAPHIRIRDVVVGGK